MPQNEARTRWSCWQSAFNMCYPFDCRCKSAFQCQVANLGLYGQAFRWRIPWKALGYCWSRSKSPRGRNTEEKFHINKPVFVLGYIFHDTAELDQIKHLREAQTTARLLLLLGWLGACAASARGSRTRLWLYNVTSIYTALKRMHFTSSLLLLDLMAVH